MGLGGEHGEKYREQDRVSAGLETAEGWLLTPWSIYCSQRCTLLLKRFSSRAFQVLLQLTYFPIKSMVSRKHTPFNASICFIVDLNIFLIPPSDHPVYGLKCRGLALEGVASRGEVPTHRAQRGAVNRANLGRVVGRDPS